MKRFMIVALALAGACASSGTTSEGAGGANTQAAAQVWPVLTRKHVDLWLHGYAMLLRDTSTVPVFRRGYRDKIQSLKGQRSLSTMIDANKERLQSRLALNPGLVNGQFLPMYFANWDQMRQVIGYFVQANGNVNQAGDASLQQYFAVLAASFPTATDRDWLRLFTESLEDERRAFYDQYWQTENSSRIGLIRSADSLWQANYRLKFQRFLNNTQQETGDLILALTLGGEGRTVNFSRRQNAVATTMPERDPLEALFVFAHEIVSSIVATAVNDNTTPTEQRSGLSGRYVTTGSVRGGALLIQRAAPELLQSYMRYYLTQAGLSTGGDITTRFNSTFPLPDAIRQAIERQLDVVMGGI